MNMLHASNQTDPGAVTTADTRADSFARVSAVRMKSLNDKVVDLVRKHQGNGGKDMSCKEIQSALELMYPGSRFEMSTLSGCLTKLVNAGRLQRGNPRRCLVNQESTAKILPVFAPAKQASLV